LTHPAHLDAPGAPDAPPASRRTQRADDEDDIETIRDLRAKSRLDSSQASTDIMKLHAAAAAPAGGPIDAVALDSAKKRKVFAPGAQSPRRAWCIWCIKMHQVETDAPRGPQVDAIITERTTTHNIRLLENYRHNFILPDIERIRDAIKVRNVSPFAPPRSLTLRGYAGTQVRTSDDY
jgi:hypothetical protein